MYGQNKLQIANGNLSTNYQETARTLNNYFTTVFEKEPDGSLPKEEISRYTSVH